MVKLNRKTALKVGGILTFVLAEAAYLYWLYVLVWGGFGVTNQSPPEWVQKQIDDVRSGHSTSIYLYDVRGVNAILADVAHEPKLRSITFEQTDLNGDGLALLLETPNLEMLHIDLCRYVDDAAIRRLSG